VLDHLNRFQELRPAVGQAIEGAKAVAQVLGGSL
jgi:hypothetical protein